MKLPNLFSKLICAQSAALFDSNVGYEHIKRLFRMTLDSDSVIHILLVGPPASAKRCYITTVADNRIVITRRTVTAREFMLLLEACKV